MVYSTCIHMIPTHYNECVPVPVQYMRHTPENPPDHTDPACWLDGYELPPAEPNCVLLGAGAEMTFPHAIAHSSPVSRSNCLPSNPIPRRSSSRELLGYGFRHQRLSKLPSAACFSSKTFLLVVLSTAAQSRLSLGRTLPPGHG